MGCQGVEVKFEKVKEIEKVKEVKKEAKVEIKTHTSSKITLMLFVRNAIRLIIYLEIVKLRKLRIKILFKKRVESI